jgi:hypothetical protein
LATVFKQALYKKLQNFLFSETLEFIPWNEMYLQKIILYPWILSILIRVKKSIQY